MCVLISVSLKHQPQPIIESFKPVKPSTIKLNRERKPVSSFNFAMNNDRCSSVSAISDDSFVIVQKAQPVWDLTSWGKSLLQRIYQCSTYARNIVVECRDHRNIQWSCRFGRSGAEIHHRAKDLITSVLSQCIGEICVHL